MVQFQLVSDFVINDTLTPHVKNNFRVVPTPGKAIHNDPITGAPIYPTIVTTGSGDAIHSPIVFTKLIELTGKERPKVVYIGTPFFDREDKYEKGTASFRKIGCSIKRLMVAKECTTPSEEEMRRIVVDWADLLIISGGNSLFAMLRWQSIGLDLLIKEAATKGKVLCGGSAGCGCYFESMQTDSLKPEACKLSERVLTELSAEERLNWSFVRITCLGFINAFCVPHIDTVGSNNVARSDIAKKMLLEAHVEAVAAGDYAPIFGLGVDEKAAIVYEQGKLSIISAGPRTIGVGDATCHILFVNNLKEVMCIPITPNTGEAATLEELIDRAIRSVVVLQSPLDLIVRQDISDACHRRGMSGSVDWAESLLDEKYQPEGLSSYTLSLSREIKDHQAFPPNWTTNVEKSVKLTEEHQGHPEELHPFSSDIIIDSHQPILSIPEKERLSEEDMALSRPPATLQPIIRSPSFNSFLEIPMKMLTQHGYTLRRSKSAALWSNCIQV